MMNTNENNELATEKSNGTTDSLDEQINVLPDSLEEAHSLITELRQSLAEAKRALETAEAEAAASKDKYLRGVAEGENLKRRLDRERNDILQFSLERIMTDLLPVLDSVDKATAVTDTVNLTVDSLKSGLELVKKQLLDAVTKHGLAAVETENAKFDPNFHQAIQRVESTTAKDEMVKQVFAGGYTLNGRLIRPAVVSVEVPAGS